MELSHSFLYLMLIITEVKQSSIPIVNFEPTEIISSSQTYLPQQTAISSSLYGSFLTHKTEKLSSTSTVPNTQFSSKISNILATKSLYKFGLSNFSISRKITSSNVDWTSTKINFNLTNINIPSSFISSANNKSNNKSSSTQTVLPINSYNINVTNLLSNTSHFVMNSSYSSNKMSNPTIYASSTIDPLIGTIYSKIGKASNTLSIPATTNYLAPSYMILSSFQPCWKSYRLNDTMNSKTSVSSKIKKSFNGSLSKIGISYKSPGLFHSTQSKSDPVLSGTIMESNTIYSIGVPTFTLSISSEMVTPELKTSMDLSLGIIPSSHQVKNRFDTSLLLQDVRSSLLISSSNFKLSTTNLLQHLPTLTFHSTTVRISVTPNSLSLESTLMLTPVPIKKSLTFQVMPSQNVEMFSKAQSLLNNSMSIGGSLTSLILNKSRSMYKSHYVTLSLGVCLVYFTSYFTISTSINLTLPTSLKFSSTSSTTKKATFLLSFSDPPSNPTNQVESSTAFLMMSSYILSPIIGSKSSIGSLIVTKSLSIYLSPTRHVFSTEPALKTSSAIHSSTPVIFPTDDVNALLLVLLVDRDVKILENKFKKQLEVNIANTYVYLLRTESRRKRRDASNGNITVKIFRINRSNELVYVEFKVLKMNQTLLALNVVDVLNLLSLSGLERKLGYTMFHEVQVNKLAIRHTLHKNSDVLGMLLQNISIVDFNNTRIYRIEKELALFFQTGNKLKNSLTIYIFYSKIESDSTIYVEFYVRSGLLVYNASFVERQFSKLDATSLLNKLGWMLLVLPYASNKLPTYQQHNQVKMTINITNTIGDLTKRKIDVEYNISQVYLKGKSSKRNRRALSSVAVHITNSPDLIAVEDIIFIVVDGGVLQNAVTVASTMNALPINVVEKLLNTNVISRPTPVLSKQEAPSYWIIAAVIGPTLLITFLCVILLWRWKVGGPSHAQVKPQAKTTNGIITSQFIKDDDIKNSNLREDEKEHALIVPIQTENNKEESNYKTSKRKKIKIPHPIDIIKKNSLNEFSEVEEAEDEDTDDDCTVDTITTPTLQPPIFKETINEGTQTTTPAPDVVKLPSISEPQKKSKHGFPKNRSSLLSLNKKNYVRPMLTAPSELTDHILNESVSNDLMSFEKPHSAAHLSSFVRLKESEELPKDVPLRFRMDIQQDGSAATPTTKPTVSMFVQQAGQDLQHKFDIERQRNKQRQRENLFNCTKLSTPIMQLQSIKSKEIKKNTWKKQQSKIDSILDPDSAAEISNRKSRVRRRIRRKNKISMSSNPTHLIEKNIELRDFKNNLYPDKLSELPPESDDSEISVGETRRRVHTLLDDTFNTLQKYKANLLKTEDPVTTPNVTNGGNTNTIYKNSTEHRSDGMALFSSRSPPTHAMPPFTSQVPPYNNFPPFYSQASPTNTMPPLFSQAAPTNVNSSAGAISKQTLMQQKPYVLSGINNIGIPFNSVLQFDSNEQQRYLNKAAKYPSFEPTSGSFTFPYPNNLGYSNVIMAPMQSNGSTSEMMWGVQPYQRIPMNRLYSEPTNVYHNTKANDNVLALTSRSGENKSSAQPLVRAIKEELLKLSSVDTSKLNENVVGDSNV